ncbi:MAG: PEP-CTERM sorting domain-containing protein [Isosphaerales bacterium]
MKRVALISAAVVLLVIGAAQVKADTIVGPSAFGSVGGNDTLWGIQFTALDNSTLTSFVYNHNPTTFGNPFSGTISLNDLTAVTTPYTSPYAAFSPNPLPFSGLSVGLVAGHDYQLVATSNILFGANDEVYQYGVLNTPPFSYPVSDTDITVTQGVFNNNPGFQESFAWGAFTNITTSSAVPEPGSLTLLGIGALGLVGYVWRRKTAKAGIITEKAPGIA